MFEVGGKVVCINGNFPWIKKYGGKRAPSIKPKKGEILIIDEILGEFLRFNVYDTSESFNWWIDNQFAPVDEFEIEDNFVEEALEKAEKEYKKDKPLIYIRNVYD